MAAIDSSMALTLALLINAAILILAASTFHVASRYDVADLGQAYHLLSPMLGAGMASVLFAVALLAAGQNSTVTGTLAGQIVAEGFGNLSIPVWARRSFTRLLAIAPAAIIIIVVGDAGATKLLIASQVLLSLQLPFAVVPLVRMTNNREMMGALANSRAVAVTAWAVAAIIIALNAILLWSLL